MPTTIKSTRENLEALQELDRLWRRNGELDKILREIRDSFVVLTAMIEPRQATTFKDAPRLSDHPEIRETLEKLVEDLRHVHVDSYSLGQAITHTEQLDQLLEEAHSDLMSALTRDEKWALAKLEKETAGETTGEVE